MRVQISSAKAMAREALLGNYGTASGALLLAWFLDLLLMGIWEGLGLVLVHWDIPGDPGEAVNLIWLVLCSLSGTVISLTLMTGEFRICYQICYGRRAGTGDLFFVLTCHPLRFAGLWLVFLLAGLAALVPGGMLFFLAIIENGDFAAGLFLVGGLVSAILECLVLIWYLAALTEVMEDLDRDSGGDYEGWRLWACLGTGWQFVASESWRLVWLCLGFAGLSFLGIISLGIGFLWIIPYFFCTVICLCRNGIGEDAFYDELPREEADHAWGYPGG